jgi:NSS family neurotransmitter:Na+ symporter
VAGRGAAAGRLFHHPLLLLAVIAGWTLLYIFGSLAGYTANLDAAGLAGLFAVLTESPVFPVAAQLVFLALTVSIVIIGVKKGIERWGLVLMPGILVFLLILFLRTIFFPGVWGGIAWFLRPNLQALSIFTVLDAVGQVFFSFSLGMGAILTYGSYLPRDTDIPASSLVIALVNLGVALLAGLIVIPSLFVFGLDPDTGPGLIFITLPAVFNTIPLGMFWSTLFFMLLAFAALTSAISMLEVVVAYLIEELGWRRFSSALAAGAAVFALSVPAGLSRGVLGGVKIGGLDIFAFLDYIASNLMLALGGLFMIIFVGWVWDARRASREIRQQGVSFRLQGAWSLLVRFVVPLAIAYILFSGLRP